jgi:disulfide bond formation protein DsbB
MSVQKKRDDEKAQWLIVGILFTGFLLVIDIFYSSFGEMAGIAKVLLGIAHAALAVMWIAVMVKFNDPKYDIVRKYVVGLSVVLSLIIGIHHAVVKENKQVLIDSHENSLR